MTASSKPKPLAVARTWEGVAVDAGEAARVTLDARGGDLEVRVVAPFHGDPAPERAPGRCPGLWKFEVVELFLLGESENYLELEFGPHAHYLALAFAGERQPLEVQLELEVFECARAIRSADSAQLWTARAVIPAAWLPLGLDRANAYAIHGEGEARRHLVMHPLGGDAPDFHRIRHFPAWQFPEGVVARGTLYAAAATKDRQARGPAGTQSMD